MITAQVAEMMHTALGPCCEKSIILAATSCAHKDSVTSKRRPANIKAGRIIQSKNKSKQLIK